MFKQLVFTALCSLIASAPSRAKEDYDIEIYDKEPTYHSHEPYYNSHKPKHHRNHQEREYEYESNEHGLKTKADYDSYDSTYDS